MNVLLIGAGGREHALAWAIAASPILGRLYAAPGNPGIAQHAELVGLDIADHAAIIAFCRANAIDFVVVGPEAPLVAGIVDDLAQAGIKAFGPSKAAARLEGSKAFTKELCREAGIPTACYRRFSERRPAEAYVRSEGAPIVIKADGLAAGKGVTVAMTLDEALSALADCFDGAFGASGAEVVVEAFMQGEEASFFVLTDGEHVLPLATAQDHKRAFDGDTGPNTGGMGAYSPAPCMTSEITARALDDIVRPTVATLAKRGTPYKGVLYAGLMLTEEGPKLVEYNCRFGDPEAQVLMPRLKDDILLLMLATADGTLGTMSARWFDTPALTVVMAANGYPSAPTKGSLIRGLDRAGAVEGVTLFHAGTASKDGALIANGGRVLNVTAVGADLTEARARAYRAVDLIDWSGGFCRRDIGWRALGL